MGRLKSAVLLALLVVAPAAALAQSYDSAAAERARIGEERIRAEAELRAREETRAEQARRAAETAAAPRPTAAYPGPAQAEPPRSVLRAPAPAAAAPATPSAGTAAETRGRERISTALEQLRQLGELKDAGYLTEDEFRRIKERILAGGL